MDQSKGQQRKYTRIPLNSTENGAACADRPGPDGSVAHPERVAYLDAHFRAARRSGQGRGPARRVLKRSARWYRDVIARNMVGL